MLIIFGKNVAKEIGKFLSPAVAKKMSKKYENWFTNKKSYCKNKKGVVFFETQCSLPSVMWPSH